MIDTADREAIEARLNTLQLGIDKILELLHVRGDYKTGTIEEPEIDPGLVHVIEQVQTED